MNVRSSFFATLILAATFASAARGDVKLAGVLSDRAVLQRDVPIPIWGWAAPGEAVTVTLADLTAKATADDAGRWRVTLPAMKAGGPHKLTVAGKNTITVQDLLVGEVWICVGQSNMQLKLNASEHAGRDIPKAGDPLLRLSSPMGPLNTFPQSDVSVGWSHCNPGSAANFSAVAYYFGKSLREKLGVPVGLIHSSAGAIPIEAWTPAAGCEAVPSQRKIVRLAEQVREDFRKQREESLAAWAEKAKRAIAAEAPLPPLPPTDDRIVQRGWMPTTLYNSTIHPLIPYAMRGVIYYQGEANNGQGMEYVDKMNALIGGWRKAWGQGDFPFLFVQLAPWAKYPEGNLEGIWEAQTAALAIPNTGMAVTTDLVPDLNDIHPRRKMEIGQRLALWALANTYGETGLIYSGPLFKSATVEANKIRVKFDHIGTGLTTRDGKTPDLFEVGTVEGFVPAQAAIDGDSALVWSDKVARPEFVRFGWKNTANPNLINKEGLPASPFRSDCGAPTFSTGSRFAHSKKVELSSNFVPGVIRYTLDGTTPTEQSSAYTAPIELKDTTTIRARLFAENGRKSVVATATYTKSPAATVNGKTLAPGIDFEHYVGRWIVGPNFDSLKPERRGVIDGLEPLTFAESFLSAHRFKGYIDIPTDGEYTFTLKSQGGARLALDGKLVVDDDVFHGLQEKSGGPARLTAGKHPFVITYHEGGGSPILSLLYEGPGIAKQRVPDSALFREE